MENFEAKKEVSAEEELKKIIQQNVEAFESGKPYDQHLVDINNFEPDRIEEEDFELYKKYLDGQMNEKDVEEHWIKINKYLEKNNRETMKDSRASLAAYLANKLTVENFKKQMEERERKKQL
ncbi:MAG: hypothetical protein COU40_00430 [Candidatus Moranbacteria bacterium CG10_big_fil_rev_8_21_14_0_10_35_21]|nr:MAG: hypothetical protein COU40_00430 [Candidatus Moranbacteria bacterium CG10_big_fil_rev_8_21_14_0_10_35_21]PJA88231.1 MAG: hypothetical protein CO139_04225 [Candidatus Moranbacteria bacterium CG_4_9_14_3_um_filter_36_9]